MILNEDEEINQRQNNSFIAKGTKKMKCGISTE